MEAEVESDLDLASRANTTKLKNFEEEVNSKERLLVELESSSCFSLRQKHGSLVFVLSSTLVLVALFRLLLPEFGAQVECQTMMMMNNEQNGQKLAGSSIQLNSNKHLVAANSIFGSLLGSSSSSASVSASSSANNGNFAAQQTSQLQQQQAADLHQSYKIGQTSDKVTLPGDILLGGLFPIHMKGTKVECGEINRDRGIQRLEAMLYALDRINEDSELLPEIKLGAILLDSCSSSTYALNQSLEFIRASINTVESSAFECKDKSTPRPKYGSKMIAGVIGGSYSEVSLQVANLLRLFRIPQVSYASTGTALSDKTLYDLFARTVPSDMFQARAIADIVLKLNWSYVSLVSSEGLYGDSGSKEFMKQASVRRICIATHEKVSPTTDESSYDIIVANLLKRNATGVVLFTRAEDTKELLKAVKRAGLFHNFAWVAADGWGTHQKLVEGVEEVAWGAITVELQAKAIPGFDQYMKALTPWGNLRNPWFSEYWQEWFDCQLQANLIQQQQVASGAYSSQLRRPLPSPLPLPTSSNGLSQDASMDYGSAASLDGQQDYESSKKRRSLRDDDCFGLFNSTTCHQTKQNSSSSLSLSFSSNSTLANLNVSHKNNSMNIENGGGEQTKRVKRSSDGTSGSGSTGSGGAEIRPKQFCSPNLRISESNSYRQEQKVQFVVDAVYAMAHALHKAWHQLCDAQPGVVCEALKELNGGEFYAKYLLNVSFKDLAGSEVKFDEHGDGLGRYNIYNYRQVKPQITAPNLANLNRIGAQTGSGQNNSLQSIDAGTDGLSIDELEGSDSLTGKLNGQQQQQQQQHPGSELLEGISNDQMLTGRQLDGLDQSSQTVMQQQPGDISISSNNNNNNNNQEERIFTSNDRFEYSAIGRWDENEYYLHLEDIEFIQGDRLIPESYCSRPCELGQAKIMRAGDHCCWICKTCAPYEYLPDEFSCRDCGIGRWPELNKTSCFDLPQKYLRWDSVYSLMSLTIACLGIALTLFVSVIFIKYLDTPVVKASGRELSFILLAGIGFCHLSTFVLLSKPTPFICGSQRFLVNFGFALMYASLLVKTNRISRIFNCARKSAKRPSFISPKSQMLITGILVAIQIFLTIVWFVFEPPGIRADSPEGKRDEVILKCRAKGKSFIISLVYNMILITTCTVYAVKTRKIPENFNESKFIGFTMYTTIVIWLAFVTMFFGTNNSYEIQINTMCVCISLSAYVTLFCLFSPKLSIILLHPDKNVRKLTMNSATYKRPFKPVSSFASVDGRNNTTGTAYNGQQTDGGSGPMSTTSNVLNLAESQAARLQESSIVSNVVNSNSAGSNCSQKTPTTLSQQLTLIGACANCGSHQLTQVPAATAPGAAAAGGGALANSSGNLNACESRNSQLVSSRGVFNNNNNNNNNENSQVGGLGTRTSGSHMTQKRHIDSSSSTTDQFAIRTPVSMSRSAILVSSVSPIGNNINKQVVAAAAAAAGGGGGGGTKAKVLHSKIMAQQQQQQQELSASKTPVALKRMSSDEHLLMAGGSSTISGQQVSAMKAGNSCSQQQQQIFSSQKRASNLNKNGRHLASLSRLNELTSTTSSDRYYCIHDESISSLANDSLVNTSQENTPFNVAGGHLHNNNHLHNSSSQGGQTIIGAGGGGVNYANSDYCSDCCPSSYCHCSCPACSLSNGADDTTTNTNNQQVAAHLAGESSGAICRHAASGSHHDTEVEDYDQMLDCSLMVQEDSSPPSHHQHHQQHHPQDQYQQQSAFLLRRRKSEEPASKMGSCYYFSGQQAAMRVQQHQHQKDSDNSEQDTLIRVQMNKPSTGTTTDSGESSSNSLRARVRSQTMEMQTIISTGEQMATSKIKANNQQSDHGKSKSQPIHHSRQQVSCSNQPVVYALQAAATSALSGGCTGSQVVSSLESSTSTANGTNQQQQQQQHYIQQFTSSKDKNSEKNKRISDSGRYPLSQSSKYQQQESPDDEKQHVKGAIQASIELVKSTSQRRSADARRQERESSCFNYHDDYEYNYGLVQSNSDSENYCCEEDSGGGDPDEVPACGRSLEHSSTNAMSRQQAAAYSSDNYRFRGGRRKVNTEEDDDDDDDDEEEEEEEEDDNLVRGDGDIESDAEEDEDLGNDDDDDFEHDGRVTLNRQSTSSTRTGKQQSLAQQNTTDRYAATAAAAKRHDRTHQHRGSVKDRQIASRRGSGSGRRTQSSSSGGKEHHPHQFQMDDHRINSVALITATLSAGGAIVESSSGGSHRHLSSAQPTTAAVPNTKTTTTTTSSTSNKPLLPQQSTDRTT